MKSRLHILIAIVGMNLLITLGNTYTLETIQNNSQVYAAEQAQISEEVTEPTMIETTLVTTEYFSEQKEIAEAVTNYSTWKSIVDQIDSNREFLEVPNEDTSFKSYMSYKAITNKKSLQYKMQQEAWTDENGLRRYGDAYMVAMGTFYANSCGEYFEITLESGESFTVVTGDIKSDSHTDDRNMYSPVYIDGEMKYANILEFIVDTSVMSRSVRRSGNIGTIDRFGGQIKTIERIRNNE